MSRKLNTSRYLALIFAVVLAVVEAYLNMSRPGGEWQYAPLWIIDYVIVIGLIYSFWKTRHGRHVSLLAVNWALAIGVFYMALFVSLDPEMKWGDDPNELVLYLIGLSLCVQCIGLGLAFLCLRAESARKAVD